MLTALADDEIVQLPQLQPLKTLWQKFDDNVQDDAAHFLLELKDLAQLMQVIMQRYHVDHRHEVQQRTEFPARLIFEDKGHPQEFEELINHWANQAEGQVLAGRGLWVAQIGRYTFQDLEWTKHHQALNVPSIFNLPYALDGNKTQTVQYSLIGLLCHSHKSGHFYAVFAYRGLYWIVDDGSYPRLVAQLQESLKTQIVQVWAIPSNMLLPDAIPHDIQQSSAEHSEVPPNKRQCTHGVSFSFANVTSLGQAVRQWILGRERTPIFLAETHVQRIMRKRYNGLAPEVLAPWEKQRPSALRVEQMEGYCWSSRRICTSTLYKNRSLMVVAGTQFTGLLRILISL